MKEPSLGHVCVAAFFMLSDFSHAKSVGMNTPCEEGEVNHHVPVSGIFA